MARKVYMATLERFGYNMTVIDTTKAGAMEKLLTGYREAYIRANKTEPEKDLIREFDPYEPDESNRTYMDLAREEISVNEMELGSVWWL